MADLGKVLETLRAYKDRSETSDCLKLTPFMKCVEACGLKQYKTEIEASVWPPLQDKAKKISCENIYTQLLPNLAAYVVGKKRKLAKSAPVDDPEVQALTNELRFKLVAKAGEAILKTPKVDATTARLTDASGFTGSHKERFDASGKGKGIEGRKDLADASGYVGNYKGAGTFDKKH